MRVFFHAHISTLKGDPMATNLNSAFGGDTFTVDSIVQDPTWISQFTYEYLDNSFLEEAIFRQGGPNDGVVAYREAAAPFLNDEPEEVAEFAEIPVSDLGTGKVRKLVGVKTALGIRVSREMRKRNQIQYVTDQFTALRNTMVKAGIDASVRAFRNTDVPTLTVTEPWESATAAPLKDLRQAKRLVSSATAPNKPDTKMGYRADTFIVSESDLELLLWHDDVQRLYRGNLASENPLFKGDNPQAVAGLRILSHPLVEDGNPYVLMRGVAGFISDGDPLTVTDLYSPGGENGYGGSNQSWRADAFRERIIALDNPRAVVKLAGIEA